MAHARDHPRGGLALRVLAAFAVQGYADRLGKPCLFGDTTIYWELARAIREGRPFVVDQSGVPHHALRTPGYPLFLAACQALFGERILPVRLVQAALGTLGVYFVYRLVDRAVGDRKAAIIAAGLAAVEPYGVGLGADPVGRRVHPPDARGALGAVRALDAQWRGAVRSTGRSSRSGRGSCRARRSSCGRRGR